MKAQNFPRFVLMSCLVLWIFPLCVAQASPTDPAVDWDFEWNGDVEPTKNPGKPFQLGNDEPSYGATYSEHHKQAGNYELRNVTGTLNADKTYTLDSGGVKQTALSFRNETDWTGWDPGNYSLVEMRVRVDEMYGQTESTADFKDQILPSHTRYAQFFRLINAVASFSEAGRYAFFLRGHNVGFGRDGTGSDGSALQTGPSHPIDMSKFRTFRIALYDDRAEVYLLNESTQSFDLVFTNDFPIPGSTGPNGPLIEFGDVFDRLGSGRVTYDYIKWDNNRKD